ncbi:MAG TPA: hypothetical protein VGL93_24590 [Streptosporangiaceae bacterium]
MSDTVHASVSDAYGPVLAGAGFQQNIIAAPLVDAKGRSPRKQAVDGLQWLYRCFVHPSGFNRARGILESTRTVFLDAPPGSGRITTAKMLLWERRRDADQFFELPCDEDDDAARIDDVNDGDRLWLDLSNVDRAQWDRIHPELSALRNAVNERTAHLVVILPHHLRGHRSDLSPQLVTIERGPVHEVLLNHLRAEGLGRPDLAGRPAYLRPDAPLGDVPEFVRLVIEARDSASGTGTISDWCERANEALAVREHDVAHQVRDLADGAQRALLLVTAMLHGAHNDSVQTATSLLLEQVAHPADESPLFARAPLHQRLHEIGAEIDDADRVRFTRLGYDSVVCDYFWRNMPELHKPICEWMNAVAGTDRLADDEYADLVRRFTQRCLPQRYLPFWSQLVVRLTGKGADQRRVNAATLVLQRGIRDERHAAAFRRQIYDWATTKRPPDRLYDAVIVACRDEMIVNHPDAAMVRIHHVARRETGTRALDVLYQLVRDDQRFRRQLLSRMAEHMRPERWPVDIEVFLCAADASALTDPGPRGGVLLTGNGVREQLITCWDRVFTHATSDRWRTRATDWLECAAANARHRDTLLETLVTAARMRTGILGYLYHLTRVSGPRSGIRGPLLQKMNDAQGVPCTSVEDGGLS